MTFWFPHSCSLFVHHELGFAADDGVCQLVEQTKGEISPADKAAAMKAAIEKRAVALHKKMGKLVAMSNPELTDGWLREVGTLNLCPYLYFELILQKRTWELTSPLSHRLSGITP